MEPGHKSIELYRRKEMLALDLSDWQMALRTFNEMGWTPERPLDAYATPVAFVKNYEGEAMYRAWNALAAAKGYKSVISASGQMDLSVFYRIVEFVARGAFIVGRSGSYAEANENGDLE
jgi:hypothetical protein